MGRGARVGAGLPVGRWYPLRYDDFLSKGSGSRDGEQKINSGWVLEMNPQGSIN